MSLINDALKRAKEAQQQAPQHPPDLPLRPVEPGQQCARHSVGLLLPVAFALVALLALFFVWQWAQTRRALGPGEATVRAARAPDAPTAAPPAPGPLESAAAMPATATPSDWSAQPASTSSPASSPTDAPVAEAAAAPTNSPVADAPGSVATNAPPVATLAPPKPAPLRLQAILFNPGRPSAMISGKTVFVGDKVGDLRVTAIDQESATLAGSGQTNVLMLAE
jgi:cytoskeletal protein RodZ